MSEGELILYSTEDGAATIGLRAVDGTVWLSQREIAELFDKDVRTVNEHIRNVFAEGECDPGATIRKFRIVQKEGTREVTRNVEHYNLDMVISVGYRVNSIKGTQFRRWATKKLKALMIQGYAINERRLAQKEQEVRVLKSGIQILSRAIEQKAEEAGFAWLSTYAQGLGLLDDYDHESLDQAGISKGKACCTSMMNPPSLATKRLLH
jgi:hypothetical protein